MAGPGGEVAFRLVRPFMDAAAGADSDAVAMVTTPTASGFAVTLEADRGWLDSAERRWPVVVDAIVAFKDPPQSDCYLRVAYPATNYCNDTELKVGEWQDDNRRHALVRFDTSAEAIPYDSVIMNAQLGLYLDNRYGADTAVAVGAHPVARSWTDRRQRQLDRRLGRGQLVLQQQGPDHRHRLRRGVAGLAHLRRGPGEPKGDVLIGGIDPGAIALLVLIVFINAATAIMVWILIAGRDRLHDWFSGKPPSRERSYERSRASVLRDWVERRDSFSRARCLLQGRDNDQAARDTRLVLNIRRRVHNAITTLPEPAGTRRHHLAPRRRRRRAAAGCPGPRQRRR